MAPVAYGEHDVYEPAIKAFLGLWVKFEYSLHIASIIIYLRFQPFRNTEINSHYKNKENIYQLICSFDFIGFCGLDLSFNQRNQVRVT